MLYKLFVFVGMFLLFGINETYIYDDIKWKMDALKIHKFMVAV